MNKDDLNKLLDNIEKSEKLLEAFEKNKNIGAEVAVNLLIMNVLYLIRSQMIMLRAIKQMNERLDSFSAKSWRE